MDTKNSLGVLDGLSRNNKMRLLLIKLIQITLYSCLLFLGCANKQIEIIRNNDGTTCRNTYKGYSWGNNTLRKEFINENGIVFREQFSAQGIIVVFDYTAYTVSVTNKSLNTVHIIIEVQTGTPFWDFVSFPVFDKRINGKQSVGPEKIFVSGDRFAMKIYVPKTPRTKEEKSLDGFGFFSVEIDGLGFEDKEHDIIYYPSFNGSVTVP